MKKRQQFQLVKPFKSSFNSFANQIDSIKSHRVISQNIFTNQQQINENIQKIPAIKQYQILGNLQTFKKQIEAQIMDKILDESFSTKHSVKRKLKLTKTHTIQSNLSGGRRNTIERQNTRGILPNFDKQVMEEQLQHAENLIKQNSVREEQFKKKLKISQKILENKEIHALQNYENYKSRWDKFMERQETIINRPKCQSQLLTQEKYILLEQYKRTLCHAQDQGDNKNRKFIKMRINNHDQFLIDQDSSQEIIKLNLSEMNLNSKTEVEIQKKTLKLEKWMKLDQIDSCMEGLIINGNSKLKEEKESLMKYDYYIN